MGIMDFFKTPAQPPAANAPATNQPQQQQQQQQPNGQMPGSHQEPVNPLDAYGKLFEKAQGEPDTPPSFNLDPKTLTEVSSNLNFTQDISPELMQQATSGDAAALIKLMNQVGQNAYKASLSHASALTDKFVGARTEHAMKGIGNHVKSELTATALSQTPNYNHPVIKRQLDETARAFAAQHPDATPDQIAQMSVKYVQDLANALNPQAPKEDVTSSEVDWDKYFK